MSEENTKDEKIVMGVDASKNVTCAECGKEGRNDEFFSYAGKDDSDVHLCAECRDSINANIEKESKDVKMVRAIILGILASIVGGIVWFYFSVLTGMQIGYVSLGLGLLIAFAVYIGSGKKRNHTLQILAAVLTLLAIFFAEHSIYSHFANEYIQANLSEFPDFGPGDKPYIPFFDSIFLGSLISPISLIIYGVGIYVSYNFLKPRKI